jgi:hypothetical protein
MRFSLAALVAALSPVRELFSVDFVACAARLGKRSLAFAIPYRGIRRLLFRHASHRVGAMRRPLSGSAKQSMAPRTEHWIASSLRSSQ